MDVARKALILARLIGFSGELHDIAVESLVPGPLRGIPVSTFLRRMGEMDAVWATRVADAKANGCVLRYVARVTSRRVSVGLQAVKSSSTFGGLRGTDNQVVFTTVRYRENPLVITGPGAGPAVTAAGVLNDILKLAGA
ncbi:MAG: bifunctional aspartate kinase/homoserine dehydrogenase I, partial [Dehalococcoidia bacterium]